MRTLRLTDAQMSALQCAGLDIATDDDDQVLLDAWTGRDLTVTADTADAMLRALGSAANSEDVQAERGDRGARGARTALSNLQDRVIAAWRDLQDQAAAVQVDPNPAGVDYLPPDDPGDVGEDPNA